MTTSTPIRARAADAAAAPIHLQPAELPTTPRHVPDGLRGDYALADARMVVEQRMELYTEEQHQLWRELYARQEALLPGRACSAFLAGMERLGARDGLPDLAKASEKLRGATGWTISPAPGLISEIDFFTALSERRFPVTVWLRERSEMDYIVEPDIFHDFFGHAPMLFDPVFADHMQAYGKEALRAEPLGATPYLGRLYWRTIEFGVIREEGEARAYGAGILSSGGELVRAVGPGAIHEPFDLERVMSEPYQIDSFQPAYTEIESFEQLYGLAPSGFDEVYARVASIEAARSV